MSGGFFRGTSADQDTRFSNKQAKLLKSQKFPPELDHLVDTSKVKMDVMKPWIAKRVTELLGFEDEVLINFIYGLLEEKEADGKKIQIQLTGFMEKNTVKFMKELWNLLLSAQQNASGVPQQFLDAKEAEIQQRKEEDDRIAQEIQKKREKEGRDSELEKRNMMDGDVGNSRSYGDGSALNNNNVNSEEEKEMDFKRRSRTKNREDRRSRSRSLSPRGGRKISTSPRRRFRSPYRRPPSIDRHHRSSRRSTSPRCSISPRRHSPRSTPSVYRRRSPYSRRGSPSLLRRPSPSSRWGSHARRKSPFSGSRRSPSPLRHRSPARAPWRSPSPQRRRSPVRHTHSPARRQSRSPARHRPRSPSPARRRLRSPSPRSRKPRSPSPASRRPRSPSPRRRKSWSRSPVRQRSMSPRRSTLMRSPKRRRRSPSPPKTISTNQNPSSQGRRSLSPYTSKSPNHSRSSLSRDTEKGTNGALSSKNRVVRERNRERRLNGDDDDFSDGARNSMRDSSFKSPEKHIRGQDSTDTSAEEEEGSRARENLRKAHSARRKTKDFLANLDLKKAHDDSSPGEKSPFMSRDSDKSLQKKHLDQLSESSDEELACRRMKRQADSPDGSLGKHREDSNSKDGKNSEHVIKGSREGSQSEDRSPVKRTKKRTDSNSHIDSGSSGSKEPERHRSYSRKRKHKKAHKHSKHYDDSSESDSELDDKEAKRNRKEKKRLRKEERRQRREERHRRRAERHASKQKKKHIDVTLPLDPEKDDGGSDSDVNVRKRDSHTSREESDPKKLEIELRAKALGSLRAKKAINH